MAFRTTGAESGGRELIIECWSPPHREGQPKEPVHTHPNQEKRFRIIGGELAVICDGEERVLTTGEEMTIGPKEAHSFWNAGAVEAHYWQEFRPALDSAEFFATLFALDRDGVMASRSPRALIQIFTSMGRFHREIMLASPPRAVQRAASRALAPVARLLGMSAERR